MTEKTMDKTTKPRGPRRSSAEIAADYKERAEKAERKAREENTPGLKALRAALDNMNIAAKASEGAPHLGLVETVLDDLSALIEKLTK